MNENVKRIISSKHLQNIFFENTLPEDLTITCYDVSEKKDGGAELWTEKHADWYDLHIGGNSGVEAPRDCSSLFCGFKNVKNILFRNNFRTEKVENMSRMFYECRCLKKLDVGNFDTRNVKDMSWMFIECSRLEELDLSSFDTRNVKDMNCMFNGCRSLKKLNVSNFNLRNVKNFNRIFTGCNKLRILDVGRDNIDIRKVMALLSFVQ